MMGCADKTVTFQIVLNERDSSIENHILNKPACINWDNRTTLGIQNENGTSGETISGKNASSWTINADNPKGYRYTPTSQDTYEIDSVPFGLVPITPGDKIIYSWYEGTSTEPFSNDSTVVVTPNETTMYRVTAVLCGGATFADTVIVTVVSPIPGAFNPNSSIPGNTKFIIEGKPFENITRYNIKIYNRWGQMVFTSNDIEESWDGTMNNNGTDKCPDGSYAWVIYYENASKTKVTNKGSVILVR
jgi:gliding motility-associated-like protein